MSLADSLRTGVKFLLMSLGVSSPGKKPAAKPATGAGSESGPGPGASK